MAQRYIRDIAESMQRLDESREAEDLAYERALEEQAELQAAEDAELDDDEVIDPAALGFIDDDEAQSESDEFYAEGDDSSFDEDISGCLEQEVPDEEPMASLEVEVYNEDGFGEHFAREVSRNIPGVVAKVKKALPSGDLLVKMSGTEDALRDAYVFYAGKESWS